MGIKKLTLNDFIEEIKLQKEMWKKNAETSIKFNDYENALKHHHFSEAMIYLLELYHDMKEENEEKNKIKPRPTVPYTSLQTKKF